MYYLGIDGGGTKTDLEVIDGCGRILSAVKTSTCSYIQIGRENYGKVIREGAEAACRQAGTHSRSGPNRPLPAWNLVVRKKPPGDY